MNKGYVSIWRKLLDSKLWLSEPFTRGQAWVDMIMLANHKDGYIRVRGVRVEVKRGQLGWSQRSLANRWKWSRGKVLRFFAELESEKERKIVPQKNNVTSLITIINYDSYQSNGTTNSTTDGPQTGHKQYQNNNDNNGNKKEQQPSAVQAPTSKHFSDRLDNKVAEDIISACQRILQLPIKNGTPYNPFQFVQRATNKSCHPQAILAELIRGITSSSSPIL